MRSLGVTTLLTTSILAVSAVSASAEVKDAIDLSRHKISGSAKITYTSSSNIASAPSTPGAGSPSEDDDEFSLDDLFDNEDQLEEVLDELDLDQEDLNEDDIAAAVLADPNQDENAEDLDEDGIPDPVTPGNPRRTTDGDSVAFGNFNLKHAFTFDKAKKTLWKSSATLVRTDNVERDELERNSWAVNTGPEFNFKSLGLKVAPSVSFLNLNLANKNQLQSTVASFASTWKATKNLGFTAAYNHEWRNNQRRNATNVDIDGFKLGTAYVYGKNLFKASYSYKVEDNEANAKNKDANGFAVGYGRKLPWKLQADLDFKYNVTDFTDLAPGRQDDLYQYGFKITKEFESGVFFDFGGVNRLKDTNIQGKNTRASSLFASAGYTF